MILFKKVSYSKKFVNKFATNTKKHFMISRYPKKAILVFSRAKYITKALCHLDHNNAVT